MSLSVLSPKEVKLWFLLEEDRPEDRESIDDIAFEFEALALSGLSVDIDVTVDARPANQLTGYFSALGDARRVFFRRECELEEAPKVEAPHT